MTAEKKDRKPLRIKNLADLKRHIRLGTELVATAHQYHPDIVGLTRVVTKVQTNGFYSKIKDQPDHKWSTCNHGAGFWSPYNKAGAYRFTGTAIQVLNTRKNDGSVLYEMELYDSEQNIRKDIPVRLTLRAFMIGEKKRSASPSPPYILTSEPFFRHHSHSCFRTDISIVRHASPTRWLRDYYDQILIFLSP